MKPLCDSIETLAMTFLDGELAGGDARELELHLVECGPCRGHLDQAAGEHARRRQRLAPPPTPELLRARVLRALDDEDRQQRRPLTTWLLPGGAALAAVAALAVFVGLPRGKVADAAIDKGVLDRDAAALNYQVDVDGDGAVVEVAMYVLDARGLPWSGEERQINGRTLWLSQSRGWSVVKLRDRHQRGFVFVTAGMDVDQLADLVARTSLIQQLEERP